MVFGRSQRGIVHKAQSNADHHVCSGAWRAADCNACEPLIPLMASYCVPQVPNANCISSPATPWVTILDTAWEGLSDSMYCRALPCIGLLGVIWHDQHAGGMTLLTGC